MKLSAFRTNPEAEAKGVWVAISKDAAVRVARFGNPAYTKRLDVLLKPHRNALRAGLADDSVVRDAMTTAMAEHILLDWRGFTNEDGTELPYSLDAAREALAIKDFRELIAELAGTAETFRTAEIAEEAKALGNG